MSFIQFSSFSVLRYVAVIAAATVVGASALAAELSDEQIEREISRMEAQAAQARRSEKADAAIEGKLGASAPVFGHLTPADPQLASMGVVDAPAPGSSSAVPAAAKTAADESQIPVFTDAKKSVEGKDEKTLTRLSLSLGVLALVGLGSLFLIRRYTHNRREKSKHTQIQVLTQHHLGPKKTLTIVRVAGESLLLGVTDHNITLIKNLALIDDEFPDVSDQPFQNEMSKHSEIVSAQENDGPEVSPEEDVEEFQMGSVIPRAENRGGGRRWLT